MTERRLERHNRPAVFLLATILGVAATGMASASPPVRLIDLASDEHRRVVVDREAGQYLGHPTTVLLEDGRCWSSTRGGTAGAPS